MPPPRPRALGRLHIPDARDLEFPMAAPPPDDRHFRNWLVPGPVKDQGYEPHCVGFSLEAWLRAHPVVNAHTEALAVDPAEIYAEAQKVDQWPGEDYAGTSVRAGFAILKQRGLVGRYAWAWDINTVARHLLSLGPVVVGTSWTTGMNEVDRNGYLRPLQGSVEGGHAYLLTGVDTDEANPDGSWGRVRMQNSWGDGWGDGGRAWITMGAMDILLRYDGEACTAIETRVRAED